MRWRQNGAAVALTMLLSMAATLGADSPKPAEPSSTTTTAELLAQIEAQRAELERQLETLREQSELLDAQAEQITKLEAALLAVQNQIQELQNRPQIASIDQALEERLAKLEQGLEQVPEVSEVVSAGDFPGSIRIPGTDAAIKIGGQVRVTLVDNLEALGVDDRFVTAAIPIEGTEEAGKGQRLSMSARASRFNFDFRTPTSVGAMRAFIEADFAASGNVLRLRHAFGRWERWLLGQTWSTFSDPEAEPDGIDFEGLNAIALLRQVQVRYTWEFDPRKFLAGALENPICSVSGPAECVSQVPDVVVRIRVEQPKWVRGAGHYQVSTLLRSLRAEPSRSPNDVRGVIGWAIGASGSMAFPFLPSGDTVQFSSYVGRGYGSYVTDLSTEGGQDAVYDDDADELEALPAYAAYVGYDHLWNDRWTSTATAGFVWVDNLEVQPDDAYKRTSRFSGNVRWQPVPRLYLIAELLAGRRVNKDGNRGTSSQIQLGARFLF